MSNIIMTTVKYSDGSYYIGNVIIGIIRHGKGIMYNKDNSERYNGIWYMNKFYGNGTLFNSPPVYVVVIDGLFYFPTHQCILICRGDKQCEEDKKCDHIVNKYFYRNNIYMPITHQEVYDFNGKLLGHVKVYKKDIYIKNALQCKNNICDIKIIPI